MEGLHTRLAPDADDAGSLDVAYRTLDTPAGPALVTATAVGW
jgi:methylated-DNA-[protein]-cysteine S-methyltransferase